MILPALNFRFCKLLMLSMTCVVVSLSSVLAVNVSEMSEHERAAWFLEQGDAEYEDSNLEAARTRYEQAFTMLERNDENETLIQELLDRIILTTQEEVEQLVEGGNLARAKALHESVTQTYELKKNKQMIKLKDRLYNPDKTNQAITPLHLLDVKVVESMFHKAEGAYKLGRYDEARAQYYNILKVDPYNKAATRALERIEKELSETAEVAYDSMRANLLAQVDAAWSDKPRKNQAEVSQEILTQVNELEGAKRQSLVSKLDAIIFPRVDFEEATITDVMDFIRIKSKEFDFIDLDPASRGIQCVSKIPSGSEYSSKTVNLSLTNVPARVVVENVCEMLGLYHQTTPYALVFLPVQVQDGDLIVRTYSVSPEFLTYGSDQGGQESSDPFAPVQESSSLTLKRKSARELLESMGVTFGPGSTASMLPATGTLVVKNTEQEHHIVSNIVASFSEKEPKMIQLDIKVIKVQQNDHEEIAVDWSIEDTLVGALDDGLALSGGVVGNGSDIAVDMGGNPITAGNRTGDYAYVENNIDSVINRTKAGLDNAFTRYDPVARSLDPTDVGSWLIAGSVTPSELLGSTAPAPGVLSVSGAVLDGTLNTMLRGLVQKKGTDFIAQPSIVIGSGQSSNVVLGQEFTYPVEYDPPEMSDGGSRELTNFITQTTNPNATLTTDGYTVTFDQNLFISQLRIGTNNFFASTSAVTPAHPTSFETVILGSEFEILPTIGDNQQTIDISIRSVNRELDGLIDYGTTLSAVNTSIVFDEDWLNSDDLTAEAIRLAAAGFTVDEDGNLIADPTQNFNNNNVTTYSLSGEDPEEIEVVITESVAEASDNKIVMPVFSTVNSEVSASVHNGATLILGGLMKSYKAPLNDSTPILGDLPFLGKLFESKGEYTVNEQVIIAITAKIISPTGETLSSTN